MNVKVSPNLTYLEWLSATLGKYLLRGLLIGQLEEPVAALSRFCFLFTWLGFSGRAGGSARTLFRP
jgi:hypothetical protein